MAMLAERKRKVRWSLNPRGKDWSEDANKFGQKMLEKMGWSKGKGLGAQENGVLEHVKVSYKNDSQGMGYKESNDQWTQHEDQFSSLLKSLSGNAESEMNIDTTKSLEAKSKSSKARVHYQKFTRGKDLSRYSEKDLANIFGRKSLKSEGEIEEKPSESNTKEDETGNFTYSSSSMIDYFKKKMPVLTPKKDNKSDESESEIGRVGFGFTNQKSTFVSYLGDSPRPQEKNSRKRKSDGDEAPKKKKKLEENGFATSNPAFDPLYSEVKVERHSLNVILEEENEDVEEPTNNDVEIKEKRKKKKSKEKDDQYKEEASGKIVEELEDFSHEAPEKVKKKKSKKKEIVFENFYFNDDSVNEPDNNTFEVKRKESKKQKTVFENSIVEDESFNEPDNNTFEVKRKKSKKQKVVFENSVVEDESFNEQDNNQFEVKRKKFKTKNNLEKLEEETPEANKRKKSKKKNVLEPSNDETFEDQESTKKKKSKKNKIAFENENFNEESFNEPDNNTFEVKRKKSKKENVFENSVVLDDSCNDHDNNKFEVKRKKSKKILEDSVFENVVCTEESFTEQDNNQFEVKRKSKKKKHVEEAEVKKSTETAEPECDFMMNISCQPIPEKSKDSGKKKFMDWEQRALWKDKNMAKKGNSMQSMEQKLDSAQAEIENDMNEAKLPMVGEVDNSEGGHEEVAEGSKLRFKLAKFGTGPMYHRHAEGAKQSYKHLIKGDIVVCFKNSNLHKVNGYAYY